MVAVYRLANVMTSLQRMMTLSTQPSLGEQLFNVLSMSYVYPVWSLSDAGMVDSKPDVYLDDLYPDPLLPTCFRESCPAEKLGRGAAKKHAAAAQLASNKKLKVDVTVVDSDEIFCKTVVLDDSHDTGLSLSIHALMSCLMYA